ncbi:hypothetical protein RQP46_005542 [Phenoliferia psychrophenolica]
MSIAHPEFPAVADYPTEGQADVVNKALALFQEELASSEGWEDQGEREGVQLYKKPDAENPYGVPTVKGECLVENCTSDAFLAVIQLPGMRLRWDPRFDNGHMLSRFSRVEYEFYSEMKGMGWLVYPRDIVGVQKNFRSEGLNEEITVIQTSLEGSDLAPEMAGKTRATLTVSGWQLLPQGADLKVTYIVKISLNGSMPFAMVNMVATETPLCTGRAKAVYDTLGHAPFIHIEADDNETGLVLQTETFSPPASATEPGTLEFAATFKAAAGSKFHILYDHTKMYAGGVDVSVDAAGVEAIDEGEGRIAVVCTEGVEVATVKVAPKA